MNKRTIQLKTKLDNLWIVEFRYPNINSLAQ